MLPIDKIDFFEDKIRDYLKENKKATVEDLLEKLHKYGLIYNDIEKLVFKMYKRFELRRKLGSRKPIEYRLSKDFPDFGNSYIFKRRPKGKNKRIISDLSIVESYRQISKVYQFDLLLRSVRDSL